MIIKRLVNNNIAVADDEAHAGRELLVMGSGIGFKKKPGDPIDPGRIEKRYRLVDASSTAQLAELIENVPSEHVSIADRLMRYIEQTYSKQTNASLYITVLDHVSAALQRHERGVDISNPMLWDIKRFYGEEFSIGVDMLDIIEKMTGTRLKDDEAGFLALHLVSSQVGTPDVDQIASVMKIVHSVLNIVKYQARIEFDENSVYFYRFVTHLKFFAQRLLSAKEQDTPAAPDNADAEMLAFVRQKYPKAFNITYNVEDYLHDGYGYVMTDGERMYLAIHIARMLDVAQQKGGEPKQ